MTEPSISAERIPAFDELMQPLIEVMKEFRTESTLEQIRAAVARRLGLSSAQLSTLHKPDSTDRRTRYEYNLAWTCTYLKNAGLINNLRRGKWSLTEEGQKTEKLDIDQIKRRVRTYRSGTSGETVTIPAPQDEFEVDEPTLEEEPGSPHTEVQWLLLKLGQDMKLDVWIANNDRSKAFEGNKFDAQPRFLRKLPQQFDEATQRTVEHIDVIWLRGQALVAAFEIENTTTIYSGLLRLSDLISMQPDIDTPLYIVAPDVKQQKVTVEINRPTFSKATDLAERCRYISYSKLREAIKKAEGLASHLAPTFIQDYSVGVTTNV